MTISAYAQDGSYLDKTEIYLGVRRVTEVNITNKDEFQNKNRVGEQITLKAEASGLEGTAYFDRQEKDNDKIYEPIWDKGDKYKSPYKLKWTLRLKDGKETEISKNSEYFSNVTVNDAEEKTQKITFTLEKELPVGAQIRATSVHAGDKDGKAENRSELNYVKGIDRYKKAYPEGIVFDYIEVTSGGRKNLADFGFKRANRENYTLPGFESGKIPALKATYFNQNEFQQYTFFRYKEVVTAANDINTGVLSEGTWSKYYKTDDNQYTWAYMTGNNMARLFRTNKEYYIDIVNVLYNTSEKKIYWPLDESLVEPGAGWAEAGYSLKDWTCTFSDADKSFESKQEFYIPRTEMWVGPKEDNRYKTIEKSTYGQIGSEASPIKIKGGKPGTMGEEFAVLMEPTAFDLPAAYYNFTAVLEKKTASGWVAIETGGQMQNSELWNLRTQNPEIMAESTWGARGVYRISSIIKNMDWKDVSGDMFNPTYTSTYGTLPLYEDNGAGIIYIEFVE